jgi:hypothetical protein
MRYSGMLPQLGSWNCLVGHMLDNWIRLDKGCRNFTVRYMLYASLPAALGNDRRNQTGKEEDTN